jgi:hypothetical protein
MSPNDEPRSSGGLATLPADDSTLEAAPYRVRTNKAQHYQQQQPGKKPMTVQGLRDYMRWYNERKRALVNKQSLAEWAYSVNITDYNSVLKVSVSRSGVNY